MKRESLCQASFPTRRTSVRSDALVSLSSLGETQHHAARVTPAGKAVEWLPWVHIATRQSQDFLLGTYHGGVR